MKSISYHTLRNFKNSLAHFITSTHELTPSVANTPNRSDSYIVNNILPFRLVAKWIISFTEKYWFYYKELKKLQMLIKCSEVEK